MGVSFRSEIACSGPATAQKNTRKCAESSFSESVHSLSAWSWRAQSRVASRIACDKGAASRKAVASVERDAIQIIATQIERNAKLLSVVDRRILAGPILVNIRVFVYRSSTLPTATIVFALEPTILVTSAKPVAHAALNCNLVKECH